MISSTIAEEDEIPAETKGENLAEKGFKLLLIIVIIAILIAVALWNNSRKDAINIEHADESQSKAWIELEGDSTTNEDDFSSNMPVEASGIDSESASLTSEDSTQDTTQSTHSTPPPTHITSPPPASEVNDADISAAEELPLLPEDVSEELKTVRQSEVCDESEALFQADFIAKNSTKNDLSEIIDDLS